MFWGLPTPNLIGGAKNRGKNPGNVLKFSFLTSLQMHQIIKTSSYIYMGDTSINIFPPLILWEAAPPPPAPHLATARTRTAVNTENLIERNALVRAQAARQAGLIRTLTQNPKTDINADVRRA